MELLSRVPTCMLLLGGVTCGIQLLCIVTVCFPPPSSDAADQVIAVSTSDTPQRKLPSFLQGTTLDTMSKGSLRISQESTTSSLGGDGVNIAPDTARAEDTSVFSENTPNTTSGELFDTDRVTLETETSKVGTQSALNGNALNTTLTGSLRFSPNTTAGSMGANGVGMAPDTPRVEDASVFNENTSNTTAGQVLDTDKDMSEPETPKVETEPVLNDNTCSTTLVESIGCVPGREQASTDSSQAISKTDTPGTEYPTCLHGSTTHAKGQLPASRKDVDRVKPVPETPEEDNQFAMNEAALSETPGGSMTISSSDASSSGLMDRTMTRPGKSHGETSPVWNCPDQSILNGRNLNADAEGTHDADAKGTHIADIEGSHIADIEGTHTSDTEGTPNADTKGFITTFPSPNGSSSPDLMSKVMARPETPQAEKSPINSRPDRNFAPGGFMKMSSSENSMPTSSVLVSCTIEAEEGSSPDGEDQIG